jgi:hypothetical protein
MEISGMSSRLTPVCPPASDSAPSEKSAEQQCAGGGGEAGHGQPGADAVQPGERLVGVLVQLLLVVAAEVRVDVEDDLLTVPVNANGDLSA